VPRDVLEPVMNFGFYECDFIGISRRFEVRLPKRAEKLTAIYQQFVLESFISTIS
jgi:hypothetical protein